MWCSSRIAIYLLALAPICVIAENLPFPPMPTGEVLRNPIIFSPDEGSASDERAFENNQAGIVTFDPKNDTYTLWYNDLQGGRVKKSFQLGNLVKVYVDSEAAVRSNGDEYIYSYTLVHQDDSPQFFQDWIILLEDSEVTQVILNDYLRARIGGKTGLLISYRSSGSALFAGNSESFQMVSSFPPRYKRFIVDAFGNGFRFSEDEFGATPNWSLDDFIFDFQNKGVGGIVIAPGTEPLPPPLTAINELLNHAKRWGWVSEAILEQMQETVNDFQPSSDELSQLIDNLLALANGAPEVDTMLTEIKRNLPEE